MDHHLTQKRIDFLAKDFCRGFIKFCGLKAVNVKKGFFESEVLIEENHLTQDNFIPAGYSAFTTVSENFRILTVEFKINFLKPAFGNSLRCRSKVINKGKQIIVSESEVYDVRDSNEKLVAKAIITMMAVPAEKIKQA